MNPLYMGCHSDSGFVHEVTGWSSQMLFGEMFEAPPNTTKSGQSSYAWQWVKDAPTPAGSVRDVDIVLDPNTKFSNRTSMKISLKISAERTTPNDGTIDATTMDSLNAVHLPNGPNAVGIANRGLGNEGLYLQQGKEYEGYFFAKSAKPVTLVVRLEHQNGLKCCRTALDYKIIPHTPPTAAEDVGALNPGWVMHKFTLTPNDNTLCYGIAPGSDPSVHCTNNPGTAHVCIKCLGQFFVGVVESEGDTEVNIAYVVLQPGEWGRFKGLNARADVAETLQSMGIKIIRLGGSFCSVTKDNGAYYQWQKVRAYL